MVKYFKLNNTEALALRNAICEERSGTSTGIAPNLLNAIVSWRVTDLGDEFLTAHSDHIALGLKDSFRPGTTRPRPNDYWIYRSEQQRVYDKQHVVDSLYINTAEFKELTGEDFFTDTYLDHSILFNIFFPHIGWVNLPTEIALNAISHGPTRSVFNLYTDIDIISGEIIYSIVDWSTPGKAVFTASGNCMMNLPISGTDWSNVMRANYEITRAESVARNATNIAFNYIKPILSKANNGFMSGIKTGNIAIAGVAAAKGAVTGATSALNSELPYYIANTGLFKNEYEQAAEAVQNTMLPNVTQSGGLSTGSQILAGWIKQPIIIAYRPARKTSSVSVNFGSTFGWPCQKTLRLNDLKQNNVRTLVAGVGDISIEGATKEELNLIKSQISGGVLV